MAVEALRGSRGEAAASPLDDLATSRCVRAERAVLARLAGGCTVPVAAYAVLEGERLWLRAALGGPDSGRMIVVRAESRGSDPEALGRAVAEALLEKGGGPLLEAAKRP
jgi:hydroxymethylbilane synthase